MQITITTLTAAVLCLPALASAQGETPPKSTEKSHPRPGPGGAVRSGKAAEHPGESLQDFLDKHPKVLGEIQAVVDKNDDGKLSESERQAARQLLLQRHRDWVASRAAERKAKHDEVKAEVREHRAERREKVEEARDERQHKREDRRDKVEEARDQVQEHRADRREKVEEVRDQRQQNREERRDQRQDAREERRDDRRENREERRDDRRENREERQGDRRENREERQG
ncbi:MAG: hypothetical protein KDC87_10035, partial [Planctomycetes bacterium]|nr:hypothetical protein [Planctomycetota bacterium]